VDSTFDVMKKLIYLLPIVSIIMIACKEETPPPAPVPDVLPTATETGAFTFGCMINGDEVWLAKYGDTTNTSIPITATYDTVGGAGKFFISAVRQDQTWGQFERMEIHGSSIVQDPLQDDITYLMTVEHDKIYGLYDFEPEDGCSHYYHNQGGPGNLTITYLDTVAQIISGTFDMTLINNSCTSTNFVITDGVFDVKSSYP
jgi:hypothetical protein